MILGARKATAVVHELAADTITTISVELDQPALLVKAAAACDGLGPGVGAARLRAVLYDDTGQILSAGEETVVLNRAPTAWRDLRFATAGMRVDAGTYTLGLHAGGVDRAARLYGSAVVAEEGADVYADGPSQTLVATDPVADGAALYLTVMDPIVLPDAPDEHLARLSWAASQEALAGVAIAETRRLAVAGWHDVQFDVEQGANAIVESTGPLSDLVGERLRITYAAGSSERSVVVYVHDEQPFGEAGPGEEISLTRAAWARLAPLALSTIPVSVEVVA